MKVLVYTQPKELQMQERPHPVLAPGEVVLKINAVGICGSDLHAWHGHDPRRKPGLVLGHEFVGTVTDSAAPGFDRGTRFTAIRSLLVASASTASRGATTCATFAPWWA